MNSEFMKPQNLDSLLMKSSQSNLNLQSPGSYLVHSYLITTVLHKIMAIASIKFATSHEKLRQACPPRLLMRFSQG